MSVVHYDVDGIVLQKMVNWKLLEVFFTSKGEIAQHVTQALSLSVSCTAKEQTSSEFQIQNIGIFYTTIHKAQPPSSVCSRITEKS